VVWDQPAFLPAIHYQLPRVPFAIAWFRLRPALKFLKSEHFLSPQSCVTVDLMILGGASRSMVQICLLSFLLSGSRLPRSLRSVDACPFQINGRDLLRQFGFQSFQLSNLTFSTMLSPGAHDLLTRVSCRSTTVISSGLQTSGFSTPTHSLSLEVDLKLMHFAQI
jgi:hypothetical protein